MFPLEGTQSEGKACQHWSHTDKPVSFAEMQAKITEVWA